MNASLSFEAIETDRLRAHIRRRVDEALAAAEEEGAAMNEKRARELWHTVP